MKQLTVEDLGQLLLCEDPHCRRPTYARSVLPKETVQLPAGFTRANARHVITFNGQPLRLCESCRYDRYGRW